MTTRWPSLFLVALSVAMLAGVAWAGFSVGFRSVSVGGERWGVRSMFYGVSFERYARDVPPRPPRSTLSLLDPMSLRTRWGLRYESFTVLGARNDQLYVSFPWLLAFSVLPGVLWLVLLVRRPRRRVVGVCPNCEYDIRATPHRCPECGTVLRPPSIRDRLLALDVAGLLAYLRTPRTVPPSSPLPLHDGRSPEAGDCGDPTAKDARAGQPRPSPGAGET
jgi:hypothetical protein